MYDELDYFTGLTNFSELFNSFEMFSTIRGLEYRRYTSLLITYDAFLIICAFYNVKIDMVTVDKRTLDLNPTLFHKVLSFRNTGGMFLK